jgi:predicted nucleic acid-binding protein
VTIVVDGSMAIAWLYPEQHPEIVKEVLRIVVKEGATVPSLWKLEVANFLRTTVRRKRCDEKFAAQSLQDLDRLHVHIDDDTDVYAWTDTRALAAKHDLSVYDAAYLELALRRGLKLATCDKELAKAAERAGVEVLFG